MPEDHEKREIKSLLPSASSIKVADLELHDADQQVVDIDVTQQRCSQLAIGLARLPQGVQSHPQGC